MAKASVETTKMNVNSTCSLLLHQDRIPNSAKRLSKFQAAENESK